jgi:ATP phosphoribosyltransferase regulatory subunit
MSGLECIGDLDAYSEGEVVMLACRSLQEVSPDYILDLSHQGYLSGLLTSAGLPPRNCGTLLGYFKDKNAAAVAEYCASKGLAKGFSERLSALAGAYGPFEEMIGSLTELCENEEMDAAVEELRGLYEHLRVCGCAENVNIDLSIVNDMRYYNGVIFQGFVAGVPSAVLSGGRYDRLLRKFGRRAGAVGFAVYLDMLERLTDEGGAYDADVLLLYDESANPVSLAAAVRSLTERGLSVLAGHREEGIRCRRRMYLTEGGAQDVGDDA